MNRLNVIFPYQYNGTWVFDDERHQITHEPFVDGADDIVAALAASFAEPTDRFKLVFSSSPFPQYSVLLTWESTEYEGNWYSCSLQGKNMRGWLCSALQEYFESPPPNIYLQAKPLQLRQ